MASGDENDGSSEDERTSESESETSRSRSRTRSRSRSRSSHHRSRRGRHSRSRSRSRGRARTRSRHRSSHRDRESTGRTAADGTNESSLQAGPSAAATAQPAQPPQPAQADVAAALPVTTTTAARVQFCTIHGNDLLPDSCTACRCISRVVRPDLARQLVVDGSLPGISSIPAPATCLLGRWRWSCHWCSPMRKWI